MYLKDQLPFVIGVPNLFSLFLGPGLHTHFFDETEIKNLHVMGPLGGQIRIGMEMIAGKVRTVAAEWIASLRDASVNLAGSGHADGWDGAVFVSAAAALGIFQGNAQAFSDEFPQIFIG